MRVVVVRDVVVNVISYAVRAVRRAVPVVETGVEFGTVVRFRAGGAGGVPRSVAVGVGYVEKNGGLGGVLV